VLVGDLEGQAMIEAQIGETYGTLGDEEQTCGQFLRALRLVDQEPESKQKAGILNEFAQQLTTFDLPAAALYYRDAAIQLAACDGTAGLLAHLPLGRCETETKLGDREGAYEELAIGRSYLDQMSDPADRTRLEADLLLEDADL